MLIRLLPNWLVQVSYKDAAMDFGNASFEEPYGRNVDFTKDLRSWEWWEAEYARRGFRTIPLFDLEDYVSGATNKLAGLGIPRENDEAPVLHAKLYIGYYGDQQKIVPRESMTVTTLPRQHPRREEGR